MIHRQSISYLSLGIISILTVVSGCQSKQSSNISSTSSGAVGAIGRIEPIGGTTNLNISSQSDNNRVSILYVKEGDFVEKNGLLLKLEGYKKAEIERKEEESEVEEKKQQLETQRKQTKAAYYSLQLAKYEQSVAYQLVNYGAIQKNLYIIATSAYQQAKQEYFRQKSIEKEKEIAIRQQILAVKIAKQKENDYLLKAPRSGIIFSINTRVGEITSNNDPVINMGDPNQMGILAQVYRSDIGKIALGQEARVTADGFRDLNVKANVIQIGRQLKSQAINNDNPVSQQDLRVFDVILKLKPKDSIKASYLNLLQVNIRFAPLDPSKQRTTMGQPKKL